MDVILKEVDAHFSSEENEILRTLALSTAEGRWIVEQLVEIQRRQLHHHERAQYLLMAQYEEAIHSEFNEEQRTVIELCEPVPRTGEISVFIDKVWDVFFEYNALMKEVNRNTSHDEEDAEIMSTCRSLWMYTKKWDQDARLEEEKVDPEVLDTLDPVVELKRLRELVIRYRCTLYESPDKLTFGEALEVMKFQRSRREKLMSRGSLRD